MKIYKEQENKRKIELIESNWSNILQYAMNEEQKILLNGEKLSHHEKEIADDLKVTNISNVRILKLNNIPIPEIPIVARICKELDFVTTLTNGLTFGRGFYLKTGHPETTIPHELVHINQYNEYGIKGFLELYKEQYIKTVIIDGKRKNDIPLEHEAYHKAKEYIKKQKEKFR